MDNFRALGLNEEIIKALQEAGFENPTTIQEKTIPLCLQGKDVIAESATGTGKTLAFGAGIIQTHSKEPGISALILTPTRELAEQILNSLNKFAKYNPIKITSVYGGVSIEPQINNLKRAQVVVGTPGRILDHMERGTINLSKVKTLVLDEADRMLDMGFIDSVRKILQACPTDRQTLLFSATIDTEIRRISQENMRDPVKISAGNRIDPTKMAQSYYDVEENKKFSLLVHLLKSEPSGLCMVFCNTKRSTEFVASNLQSAGVDAIAIHGGYTQNKRQQALDAFHSNKVQVLVCTDVAARGIDVKDVSHVYNYELPGEEKQYLHRIGRTARAGGDGKAVNLLSSRDHDNFTRILRHLGVTITKVQVPDFERIAVRVAPHHSDGGGRRNFSRPGSRPGARPGARSGGFNRSRSRF